MVISFKLQKTGNGLTAKPPRLQAKIILVSPAYGENIGMIARAMHNFGFKELVLVKPTAEHLGSGAKSRAMHGKGLLENAIIYDSLEEALKDCAYAAATSAKTTKNSKLSRTAITARQFAKKFAGSNAKIAIVFGNESNGLSNQEIECCDFIVSVPSAAQYKTLNIAHAAAIIFYELFLAKCKADFKSAGPAAKQRLNKKFKATLALLDSIDNKKSVEASFRALTSRALITEKEASAMLAFFAETGKAIKRKRE